MTELIGFIGDVLAIEIATLGTTPITLGLMAAFGTVLTVGIAFYRRVRR